VCVNVCVCLCMELRVSMWLLYFENVCAGLRSVWEFLWLFVGGASCGERFCWLCVVFVACVAVGFVR